MKKLWKPIESFMLSFQLQKDIIWNQLGNTVGHLAAMEQNKLQLETEK